MKTTLFKPTKVTQSAKVTAKGKKQITEVCDMLGWTEDKYYMHQYEQYEAFLRFMMQGCSIEFYNKVRFSPIMRGFWNNEWISREDELLELMRFHLFEGYEVNSQGVLIQVFAVDGALDYCLSEYFEAHNGNLLYNDIIFIERFEHVLTLISKS